MNVLFPAFFEYDRKAKSYTFPFLICLKLLLRALLSKRPILRNLHFHFGGRFDKDMEIQNPRILKNAKFIDRSARAQG